MQAVVDRVESSVRIAHVDAFFKFNAVDGTLAKNAVGAVTIDEGDPRASRDFSS
jgi:hypothetical protein